MSNSSFADDENLPQLGRGVMHEIRSYPMHYQAIVSGRRTFEMQVNKGEFLEDDTLIIREYDPDLARYDERAGYTGRAATAIVGYMQPEKVMAEPVAFPGTLLQHVVFALLNVKVVSDRG